MEETIEFEGNESGQALVAQLDLVFTEIQEKEDIIDSCLKRTDCATLGSTIFAIPSQASFSAIELN